MNYSKAGCENPATSAKVDVKSGKVSLKKYWTPGEKEKGYSTRSIPSYSPALVTPEHSGGKSQQVKGKTAARRSEAKQVAGRKQ